eukprot:4185804-Ditylum_brightwellii.AAC.1
MSSVPFGEIITLTKPPYSCNVALTGLSQKWTDKVLTWESNNVPVIPLKYDSKYAEHKPYFVCVRGSFAYRPSKVTVKNHFPKDLGFAFTVHKEQGRTLERVIIALSD